MKSPVTGKEMKKIVKFGVEIEYCEDSGGVWLDHGELEKLMEVVEERAGTKYSAPKQNMAPNIDDDFSRSQPKYDDDYKYKGGYKKKESILGEIFDIF